MVMAKKVVNNKNEVLQVFQPKQSVVFKSGGVRAQSHYNCWVFPWRFLSILLKDAFYNVFVEEYIICI